MQRPNILFITTDQMRADAIGYENPHVMTPNLDRIAKQGTIFDRAYCVNSVCTPSRAAMFTGRYPQSTGAWNIGVALNEDEMTLCDWLKPDGYTTAAIGKMHFRPQMRGDYTRTPEDVNYRDRPRERDGTYFGFDRYHTTEDSPVGEYLEWLKRVAPEHAERRGRPENAGGMRWVSEMPEQLHQTRWITDRAIDAIEGQDPNQPFFMWLSYVDPHHPFNPPKKYADMYKTLEVRELPHRSGEHDVRPEHLRFQGDRGYWPGGGEEHRLSDDQIQEIIRNYYAMITFIDDELGRVIGELEKRGLRENTMIIFTSDHGEMLGDHRLLTKGPWFYEGLTRIPMFWQGPGIPSGKRTSAFMENIDIVPTLLELLGRTVPYGIQGKSQKQVIDGQRSSVRDCAITAYGAHDRGISAKCIRTDQYKLAVFAGEPFGELYDLEKDPTELRNLYFEESYKEIKLWLYEKLSHRLILDEDPLPERKAYW